MMLLHFGIVRLDPTPDLIPRCRVNGLEGGLQGSHGRLEASFEAASPHLRMRSGVGHAGLQDGAR